jgi:hypothetical protein
MPLIAATPLLTRANLNRMHVDLYTSMLGLVKGGLACSKMIYIARNGGPADEADSTAGTYVYTLDDIRGIINSCTPPLVDPDSPTHECYAIDGTAPRALYNALFCYWKYESRSSPVKDDEYNEWRRRVADIPVSDPLHAIAEIQILLDTTLAERQEIDSLRIEQGLSEIVTASE